MAKVKAGDLRAMGEEEPEEFEPEDAEEEEEEEEGEDEDEVEQAPLCQCELCGGAEAGEGSGCGSYAETYLDEDDPTSTPVCYLCAERYRKGSEDEYCGQQNVWWLEQQLYKGSKGNPPPEPGTAGAVKSPL